MNATDALLKEDVQVNAWQGFKEGRWTKEIDVREFIQKNYTPYEGDDSFLAGATENTKKL
jgi:formate C-acetyltransferase